MANYYGMCRSNYVKIRPEKVDEMIEFCNKTTLGYKAIERDDGTYYGFQVLEDGIPSCFFIDWEDSEAEEHEINWGKDFAPFLEDGEVLHLAEVGNEKLRYLVGFALWIQSDGKVHSTNIHNPPHWVNKFARKHGKTITENAY